MKRHRAKRGKRSPLSVFMVLALAALVFIGCVVWVLVASPDDSTQDTSTDSGLETTATTTTTTVSTTTTTTTTTTKVTTTTATPTTNKTTASTNGALLQYDTTGHYVQSSVSAWYLLLVNDWNAITENYEKSVSMVKIGNRGQSVDSRILEQLNAMLAAGKAHGIDVQSGYRAYSHQSKLYWRQVNNYKSYGYNDTAAQTAAGKIVKRPGYSEHNSGLAVDLGGSGNFTLTESFANTAAYKWLIENCADYGFILRFPKGKEDITGVIYEAWHFRYVGKEAAAYIMENNLCLEEYLAQKGL